MHNLTKTLAAMSLLAPLAAHSLGVGDIKLHSALNQKLNAEIALSLAADEDLADIKVSLATPEKFEKLGIEWSYFLSKVKFQPVLKANGTIVIKLTSDTIVQEPFLDFLVEVSWPKGDIYKEFTVLVDPPIVYQPSSVVEPVTSPTKTNIQTTSVYTPAPAGNAFSSLAVEGEYGPTNRHDSLWKVAEKVNSHNDVSIQQMMMALYKANPQAFYKKNVNALMLGKTLKIPEKSELLKLSNQQANAQFNRQMAVWEGKAVPEVQVASEAESSSQLKLVPPAEEEINYTDSLTANASETDNVATKKLTTENLQLQQRLANMEKQIAIMQDMMALKDQQFSTLQNAQLSAAQKLNADLALEQDQQAALDKAEAELERQMQAEIAVAPVEDPVQVVDTHEIAQKQPEPVKQAPVIKKPIRAPVKEESGLNYYYIGVGLFSALAIGGLGLLFWRRRKEVDEEINDSSMFASSSEIFLPDSDAEDELDVPVFDDSSDYGVGTVGESSFLSEFTPSDFDVFESDQAEVDPTSEADVYLAYGRYQQAEELMRQAITEHSGNDDYKLKLLEIFYTSENEEGYEGYATELVTEGKNKDLNFWNKVSEMGKELSPDSALFSPELTESKFEAPALDSDSAIEVLETVNNEAEESPVVAEAQEESVVDDSSVLDFDLSSFSLSDDDEKTDEPESKGTDESVDFDLSSFDTTATSGADDSEESGLLDTVASDATAGSIEFAIDKTDDINLVEDGLDVSEAKVNVENGLESVDFDLSSFETNATLGEAESVSLDTGSDEALETIEFNADETDDISLEDFDFSAEDSSSSELEAGASQENKTEAVEEQAESNDIDFDFNFDEQVAEEAVSADEDDLMVSDLTDMDEFETKIDLAKAYIDMGDETSAKDLAQEIIEKGNDVQKQEAQEIIDKLS